MKLSLLSCLKREATRHLKQEDTCMTSMKMMKFALLVVTVIALTSACRSPPQPATPAQPPTSPPPPCPVDGFHRTSEGCFTVKNNKEVHWDEAKELCKALGSHVNLAALRFQEVSTFMWNNWENHPCGSMILLVLDIYY